MADTVSAVSDAVKSVESLLRWIYSSFVFRDLVYISAGFIVLSVPFTAHCLWETAFSRGWYILAVFIAAHHVGLISQELMVWIGPMQMYPPDENQCRLTRDKFVEKEAKYLSDVALLGTDDLMSRLNRIIALKHLFAASGAAALVAAILTFGYWLFAILCLCRSRTIINTQSAPWSSSFCGLFTSETPLVVFVGLLVYFFVCREANRRKAAVQETYLKQMAEKSRSNTQITQ